ncbi:T9SS type A sorting domain-containing protein, partial [bacterium]|nr:T9SS type A sorting domain-containing protein [bacterium]
SIAINNSNGYIFAATFGAGIIRSTDNGDTWTEVNNGITSGNIRTLAINSNGDVFAGTYLAVFYSQDEGENWIEINTGLTNRDVYVLAIHPSGFIFAGTYASGVFRSVEPTNVVYPPAAPTLAFPLNGAVNRPIILTLHWSPYASVETYHLQLATSSDFVSTIVDDSTITSASREIGPLENNASYYWRVKAKYAGGTSPWSNVWSFTTIVRLPDQVALLSPANTVVIEMDSVQFTWRQSSPAITKYWFEVATDSLMTNVQIDSNLTASDTTKTVRGLLNDQTYWWRVRAKNLAGWGPFSEQRKFQVNIATSVQTDGEVPRVFSLSQNFPNPFNPSTQIAFSISRSGYTTLKVYNIVGREIAVLMAQKLAAGRYKVNWNTNGLPSGLYFYRLQSSEFVDTKKMILLR